ncbi:putative manganese-dependent inorganic diphosphatase [Geotalea sp. SG265]|uniref:putative manganese-dependent inorganic diphosphatase n=1 Tax=Geotalea sp. SG265 TaxID=2922867 RepID=UPI001FAF302A|nr:putative manganese-dependent inorganic diphosphatase [Geotalea sp. SG265]
MDRTFYVIGHRNPDTDSIASAIAYAALKQRRGMTNVIAAMAGQPNPQARFVLQKLGIPEPVYLPDVHPKVRDTLRRQPVTLSPGATAYEALEKFHGSGVRSLPVLDNQRRPQGVVTLLRLSENLLLPCPEQHREMTTSSAALARTLGGTVIIGTACEDPSVMKLFIGAMEEESFLERIAGEQPDQLLIITGNRRSIQQAAIEQGVRILIITGGHGLEADLAALALERRVTVLLSPHDTATTAWLSRLSTPVSLIADPRFVTIGLGEPLAHLQQKLRTETAILALEENGTLAGVATKSSLLAPLPYGLILVDHNELGQAVPGAEAVEIAEVIDHHKLGNSHSTMPIAFFTSPVGSTCTLVAMRYRECDIEPEQNMAALLLAGILSDTVILKSPTTTDLDREMVAWLEKTAGVDAVGFGRDIFAASSSLKNYKSAEDAVMADFKLFQHEGKSLGIGQVEVVGYDEFFEMKEALLAALATLKKQEKLYISGLMVTDITTESSLFLVEGYTRIAHCMDYPQLEPHLYELKGIMSRKKQMVPHLFKILSKV